MNARRQKELDEFFKNIDPELAQALLNPTTINNSEESLKKTKGKMQYPLVICNNPDSELKNVPTQLNFLLPLEIKKSQDPYIINLKNDLNMYRKTYEQYSKQVNKIIDKTKESLKHLYLPLKKINDEIKKYSKNFENSINQLTIPLQNKKESLNQIDYENYPLDKKENFKNDKTEIIKEINNFITEAHHFCENYEKMNKNALEETEQFVQKLLKLATPANELSTFMKEFFKSFERSATQFKDLNDKEKIDKALQKIKEPINEFQKKSENTLNLLIPVEEIEKSNKVEKINEILKDTKNTMEGLKQKSKNISEKIKKIREKYGEPEKPIKSMNLIISEPPDLSGCSKEIEKKKNEINKEAEVQVNIIKNGVIEIINQTRLDLLFIMDITNSMDIYLDQAKTDILEMIKKIREQCAGIDIFLGFIGYRDFTDLDFGDEYTNLEFTENYEEIKNQIQDVKASGGGDTAEDLCGALDLAKNKNWEGKSRFAILVTDSPCHGMKYHEFKNTNEDNFPDGDLKGRNIEDYIKFFSQNEISLFCLKINSTTDKMFKIFQTIYEENKNKDSKNEFVVGEGNKLLNIVTENAVKTFQNRKNIDLNS